MTLDSWIAALSLTPHREGGHFRETWRSSERLSRAALPERFDGERSLGTAIYFLLGRGEVSLLHRLRAAEVWHLHDGGPLVLHRFAPNGGYTPAILGLDIAAGQAPQQVVQEGSWFGAELGEGAEFALIGCSVCPGFDYEDFELAERAAMLTRHPEHAALITRLTEG